MSLNDEKRRKPLFTHRPVTRRDFLAQGFLGLSTTLFVPSFLSFGWKSAMAEEAAVTGIPFLVFDCAGGCALPGNFLVGKSGGPKDYLKSYSKLGWNPARGKVEDNLDESLGVPMFKNVSKMRDGILATASADARAKLRIGSICHYAQDDGDYNLHNASALVVKSGMRGTYFVGGLGRLASSSGGRSQTLGFDPAMKPLAVSAVSDITAALTYGPAFEGMPAEIRTLLGNTTKQLTAKQAKRIKNLRQGNQFVTTANQAYETSARYARGVTGLDPRTELIYQQVYGITAATAPENEDAISAGLVMNVLKKNSGPGVFHIDGCDYHDGTSATGDAKDLEIGRQIGRAVEAAHRSNSPLFFELLSDGGTYSDDNTRNWRSDDGTKAMTLVGYYNPKAPPTQPRLQVGRYTDDQGVDTTSTLLGPDASRVAYAVLANYLNVQGRLGEFATYAPRANFSNTQLDSLLVLA